MAENIIFQPVRATEAVIRERYPEPIDGYVYFAYDTGNIYMDKDGGRYLMSSAGGAGIGVIYTHGDSSEIVKVDPEDENSFIYTMPMSILDNSDVLPVLDSLILNNDGKFYRVISVNKTEQLITALLLPISGGGGGSIITYSDKAKLNKEDPVSNYLINGKEASIRVYGISGKDYDGSILDEKLTVYWTLSERTETGILSEYARGNFAIDASTEENPIWETFEYGTKARHSTENVLTMYAKGSASTESREFSYTFFTSNLELLTHTNFSNLNTYTPDNVIIYCSTVGTLEKIIFYYFENEDGDMICLNPNGTVVPSGTNEQSFQVPLSLATHGPHKVRIELYQYINGKADFTSAATPIEMEIAVVDSSNELPVIWLGNYASEYYLYDSIKIPFRVYDPQATLGATVTLFKDSTKLGTRTITDTENFSIWEIVDGDLGELNYYSITCGEDEREVRREISFLVSEDPTRVNMKIAQAGLRYVFDASGRSNSESAANRIKCSYNNGSEVINGIFEGFNWYNNGWVTDMETGNSCLRISNGATFRIPLKQTRFATQNASNQSHTFEFLFKIRNVQDYSLIIHNVTRYRGNTDDRYDTYPSWIDTDAYEAYSGLDANGNVSLEKYNEYLSWHNNIPFDNYDAFLQWYLPAYIQHYPDSGWPPSYDDIEYRKTDKILNTNYAAGKYYDGTHGICIGAQDALFTNGVDTVNVAYVEDKLINLSIVYSHGNGGDGGSNQLMSIYLNGMLTGVARSTLSGNWNIGENDSMEIVFNSQYCDFDLYKIRVYNQALTLPTILTNYTVDLKDPVGYDLTQLAVLNSSLQESQLVYNNMINYNNDHPDGFIMPYIIFTTKAKDGNVLPYSKATPITDVQIEFVNTGLERAYATGELTELANKAGLTVEEYYMHHCPSWKGDHISMSVQGTSSEFYPRRNYKAKTKNAPPGSDKKAVLMYMNRGPFALQYAEDPSTTHLDWFYYDNNTVGTTKFTLKIDYMESSGTYNMGFANLVYNAYTHHPLYDYNVAGAFLTDLTEYTVASSYSEGTTYWYKNHKGSWKNTSKDDLKVINDEADIAAAWALGPAGYAATKGITKVAGESAEGYNTWYTATTVYIDTQVANIEDYRTSVQGFPVLAFHQTTDSDGNSTGIKYIGRYNMLLDKGSDEAYGFKIDGIYLKFVQKEGKPTKLSEVAECWEAENNSRGFCSFRDAAINRDPEDTRFFDTDKLTANGAPIVADYWEYRYHDKADSLDILYGIKDNIGVEKSIATVLDECDVDISDPTPLTSPDNSYTGAYTQGIKNAGDKLLDIYSNWERACLWVWSTNQDNVPSMGSYVPVDLGTAVYEPDTYYISDGTNFIKDSSVIYDSSKAYYTDALGENIIKLCASSDLLYIANTYYVDSGLDDYVLDPDGVFNAGIIYYKLENNEANVGAKQLDAPVVYNNKTYNYDTKEYRNAKFVNDLTKHFNLEYLVTYFVMTEIFECYDSRGKNMMMASWGPQEAGGDYIWYPVFYDIDTLLGINNTGIPSFEYYVDATENGTFSTNDSILWNNLYRNFKSVIIQKYRQLKGVRSTYSALVNAPLSSIDKIEKWYLADPEECNSIVMRGQRPLIAFNLDEYYKYITITNGNGAAGGGYQDRYGGTGYDNGTYFYALQGDRSLSRQLFLTNRFNYIDSWLNQGNYERGGTNIIRGRVAANSPSNTSDEWIEGTNKNTEPLLLTNVPYWTDASETQKTHLFDGEYWIDMEPVRNSYVTVGTDAANFPSLKYTNLNGPVRFKTPDLENGVRTSGGYHEQLYYIYGLDLMKSLGDMSRLYWTEFNIEGRATKMTDLLLGYDGLDENDKHYHNNNINMYGIHASTSSSDNGGMPLLKRVNLSYILFNDKAPTYNFSSCEKLEDFRAIGSNITNITFANGVALRTLYLPDTIRTLSLTEATKLNNIVTTYRDRKDSNDVDIYPGLYIPNLTDKEPGDPELASDINTINLLGDSLGYDSYKLLNNYYFARSGVNASSYITITDVDWSPYKQLTEGFEYIEAEATAGLYWVDNGHYSFDAFTAADYTIDKWKLLIKNGELYRLDTNIDATVIKTTTLLENLRDNEKFFSTASEGNEVPIITGIMYIDNDTAINEKDIEIAFGASYPDLKLFFKSVNKAPTAKYVVLNDDGTYDVLARRSLGDNETFFPDPSTLIAQTNLDNYETRSQYDFYGWSTEPLSPSVTNALNDETWYTLDKGHLIKTTNNVSVLPLEALYDLWSTQTKEENKYDYTFYAVYYIHKYQMFYHNGDGRIIATAYVPANSYIVDYTPDVLPNKEIEDTLENLYSVYKFIGWSLTENNEQPDSWTRENIGRASKIRDIYPVFEKDSVYNNVLTDTSYYTIYNNGNLYLNNKINTLHGKITFPASVNNIPVKMFNGTTMGAQNWGQNITHIFFEKNNNQITNIGSFAFYGWSKLQYVDLPNSNMTIGELAFSMTTSLFKNIPDEKIQTFFDNIGMIGGNAFNTIGYDFNDRPNIGTLIGKTISLNNVQILGTLSCANWRVSEIYIGSPTNYIDVLNSEVIIGNGNVFIGVTSNGNSRYPTYPAITIYAKTNWDSNNDSIYLDKLGLTGCTGLTLTINSEDGTSNSYSIT